MKHNLYQITIPYVGKIESIIIYPKFSPTFKKEQRTLHSDVTLGMTISDMRSTMVLLGCDVLGLLIELQNIV